MTNHISLGFKYWMLSGFVSDVGWVIAVSWLKSQQKSSKDGKLILQSSIQSFLIIYQWIFFISTKGVPIKIDYIQHKFDSNFMC